MLEKCWLILQALVVLLKLIYSFTRLYIPKVCCTIAFSRILEYMEFMGINSLPQSAFPSHAEKFIYVTFLIPIRSIAILLSIN